ncbi:MAG: helix-turn-helix transcriptional regulator [Bacteroidales bacterium]|nr:helix-turn-helix transcriptional regulator [Clostridium sp.]MCM1204714.1 helix-turn-helix transcriptional regulator [Bacteroidales bacterium]
MDTINERVKKLRKTLDLTLEKFGEPLGVGKNAISRIETSKSKVTEQMFLAICREYNVNSDWLRTGEGAMFSEDEEEYLFRWVGRVLKDKPDSLKKRFLNFLSTLDDSDWEALGKIFNKMKEE